MISELMAHLGIHRPFHQGFGELLQQPVLPDDLFQVRSERTNKVNQK